MSNIHYACGQHGSDRRGSSRRVDRATGAYTVVARAVASRSKQRVTL
jgi:hypothetical protein